MYVEIRNVKLNSKCVVGVWGGGTVSRASWEGADAGVPEVSALIWVVAVEDEDDFLLD